MALAAAGDGGARGWRHARHLRKERVSCVNVHVCLYVTYNTPISLCTAQLSLKQTPFGSSHSLYAVSSGVAGSTSHCACGPPALLPKEASGAQQHAKGMQRRLVKIEIISDTI